MTDWKRICLLDDIPSLGSRVVRRPGADDIAVFRNADDEVFALHDQCPHKGGPLAEGTVRDGSVVCPWHWYAFDLATGECRNAHEVTLRRHEVVDVDGVPHARLTVPAVLSWAERLRAHARGES